MCYRYTSIHLWLLYNCTYCDTVCKIVGPRNNFGKPLGEGLSISMSWGAWLNEKARVAACEHTGC